MGTKMTLPYERTRAVLRTEDFLRDMLDPKVTPRIPKQLRQHAASLLKHYPTRFEMEIVSEREEENRSNTEGRYHQIFGMIDSTFK